MEGNLCSSLGIITNQKEDSGQVSSMLGLHLIYLEDKRLRVVWRTPLESLEGLVKRSKSLGLTVQLSESGFDVGDQGVYTGNECPSDVWLRIPGPEGLQVFSQGRCSMSFSLKSFYFLGCD